MCAQIKWWPLKKMQTWTIRPKELKSALREFNRAHLNLVLFTHTYDIILKTCITNYHVGLELYFSWPLIYMYFVDARRKGSMLWWDCAFVQAGLNLRCSLMRWVHISKISCGLNIDFYMIRYQSITYVAHTKTSACLIRINPAKRNVSVSTKQTIQPPRAVG